MSRAFSRFTGCIVALAALAACASMPMGARSPTQSAAIASAQSAQERVHTAMEMLDRGEEVRARALLERILRNEPGNSSARRLLDEINIDPRRQLGERSHAYTVRDSDTMTNLAERFLGDPLLFYALARYNDMAPNRLAPGQVIQIPDRGRPSVAMSLRGTTALNDLAPQSALVVSPVDTASDARANQLRLQGLERLNAGDADSAVVLLSQARAIDAGNPAIEADLNRARRIQASLRAH